MSVKQLIEQNYKTREFTKLADRFILDPSLLDELVAIATTELPHPYPEYASWLLIHIVKKAPELIEPFQALIIDRILISKNQSVLRNLTNTSVALPLIPHKESEYLDRLIQFISDDSNKVALFVYGMYKLIQFTKKYPEIKFEIDGIIALKQTQNMQPAIRIGIRNYQKATNS